MLGPATVESRALLRDPPEEALRRLHELLRAELLHPEDRQGTRTTWTRAPGLWAALQRGLNWQGQSVWKKGTTLTTELLPSPPGLDAASSIRLIARREDRGGHLAGMFFPGTALAAFALGLVLNPGTPGVAAGLIAGAAVLTTAVVVRAVRARYRQRLRDLKVALGRVLERLGASESAEP